MKKHLLKAVCLLLSVSLLCSCGTPEDESVLSSVPGTAGQVESSVDEAISSQETSITDSESKSEVTKKPETEENSAAETTTEKTETTTTTTKATETESTPGPETTTSATTTKKPETVATPKPETTTTTTSKKPETTVTPKPETTTTTTTKAPETTTIATEKPDDTPTGHCEGFNKLWGMTIAEINESKAFNCGQNGGNDIVAHWNASPYKINNNFEIFNMIIPDLQNSCYSNNVYFICEVKDSDQYSKNNPIYRFELLGGWWSGNGGFEDCEHNFETQEKCPDFDIVYDNLVSLYGKPNKSRIEGKLKIYLWSGTLDGEILLSNYMPGLVGALQYELVDLQVFDSNCSLTKDNIDYYFTFEI